MLAVAPPHPIQDARRKLLDAAGTVLAEHGFHKATVREITDRAGVNVAAINHHFHDRPLIERLRPKFATQPPSIEQLVGHIQKFSLAAIRPAQ